MLAVSICFALLTVPLASTADDAAAVVMQVVSYRQSEGRYELNEASLYHIERLPPPVRVLSAVGDARIGKSTFLNMVHLHWDSDDRSTNSEQPPFEVGDTTELCTRGVWVHIRRLPNGGSLILVDVEGANLGNDAVVEQLGAFTAILSSQILLFVREVVNNAALKFLYHAAKIFPNSAERFSDVHLGIAIRDALDLSPKFPDRKSEVLHAVTNPTHEDSYDDVRREIAVVFSPKHITAFEIEHQAREQLENLKALDSGPYFESVQQVIHSLKKTMPAKLTPHGMEMCGGDLVEMIRKLFDALEKGETMTLETAFERLEKQMCDGHYSAWIFSLMRMDEDDFISKRQHHLEEFGKLCKLDAFIQRVQLEVALKTDDIIRERKEREERRRAEEEQRRTEEEKRKAEEAEKKAEGERRKAEAQKREAELAYLREEQARKQAQHEAELRRAQEEEKRRLEAERERQLQEQLARQEQERQRIEAEKRKAQEQLNRLKKKKKKKKKSCILM